MTHKGTTVSHISRLDNVSKTLFPHPVPYPNEDAHRAILPAVLHILEAECALPYRKKLLLMDRWDVFRGPCPLESMLPVREAFAKALVDWRVRDKKLFKVYGPEGKRRAVSKERGPSSKAPRSHVDGKVRLYTDGAFADAVTALRINVRLVYRLLMDALLASEAIRSYAAGAEKDGERGRSFEAVTYISPNVIA